MATVTPNFNWPVPTSTDLVKDGATAIEALGDSIDASLVDLKGGTTGQVLSKTSGTDMDFTWVTTDDANAIQNSIVDAKGDLISATANDTPARLAVGANGETLVADSSTSTGLRYTAGTVQSNPVLNSAMQIGQRGTSFSVSASTSGYTLDRWIYAVGANQASTFSRQVTNDTTNLPFIQYCARVQRNSGQTGTGTFYFSQSFETVNSIPYVGKQVTFSFYARAGANYSPTSSILIGSLVSGTGTDQNYLINYTGVATVATTNAALTTTWQRFSVTGTVATSANELSVAFATNPTGTAGAADYYEVTGVQIDIGSVALPFRTYAGTIQGETSACQRYYWRSTGGSAFSPYGNAMASATTTAQGFFQFPITMRVAPTSIDFSTLGLTDSAATFALTGLTLSNASPFATLLAATGLTGLTINRYYQIVNNNSTSGYLGFSAEL